MCFMGYMIQKRRFIQQAKQIARAKNLPALAVLLDANPFSLMYMSSNPVYQVFRLPKPGGGERLIEAPDNPLKQCLQKLNDYLQAWYYLNKTEAAYGFIAQPGKDPDPRNIISNAGRHVGNDYLLNVDLKDFFHQVTEERMQDIFGQSPFSFDEPAIQMLAKLVTFNGRLPMGAPTSPVCSNIAAINVDAALLAYTKSNRLTYTRFADDLSFSAAVPLPAAIINDVTAILAEHRFAVNNKKVKQYGPKDIKMITGLEVGATVQITQLFMDGLCKDMERFKHIRQVQCSIAGAGETVWVETFRKALEGKINFVGMVYGYKSDRYQYIAHQYEDCYEVETFMESRSWLDIPYQF
jgi:RNA-directed DNA polymerase